MAVDSVGVVESSRFSFHPVPLSGVWRVSRRAIGDARGYFSRFYCASEFAAVGVQHPLVQINHSLSRRLATIRGLHFQHPPHAETKIVSCMVGRIFDVAVDVRKGSPTFLQWFGAELSAENQQSLVIPPGFAHGYQTLTEDAEVLYLVTAAHSAEAEDGINPLDPAIGVQWPLPASEVSQRDSNRPMLDLPEYAGVTLSALDASHG